MKRDCKTATMRRILVCFSAGLLLAGVCKNAMHQLILFESSFELIREGIKTPANNRSCARSSPASTDLDDGADFRQSRTVTVAEGGAPPAKHNHSNNSKSDFDEKQNTNDVHRTINKEVARLSRLTIRYYIYDLDDIVQSEQLDAIKQRTEEWPMEHFRHFMEVEDMVLKSLSKHSLRTYNADEADLFIVPIHVSAHLMPFDGNKSVPEFDRAFDALYATPMFQRWHGHRHVIISTNIITFNMYKSKLEGVGLPNHHSRLYNVTVASSYDMHELEDRFYRKLTLDDDFNGKHFHHALPVVESSFSMGLLADEKFPYRPATYDKFTKSNTLIFYQTRKVPFLNNSTKYRFAPIDAELDKTFPEPSMIGIGKMNPATWLEKYTSSKFCLVIRGDTPHSRALVRSVKIGCIPVIISDDYPWYAPTFKSTLNMSDFSIIIPEARFLQDPVAATRSALLSLTEHDIRVKLANLAFAQRVVSPDHPRSLFVQAFVREAMNAQTA